MKVKEALGHLTCCQLHLTEYDFEVKHTIDCAHTQVDGLSILETGGASTVYVREDHLCFVFIEKKKWV